MTDDTTPAGAAEEARAALYARLHSDSDAPPWAWHELPPDEARALMADAGRWVDYYNSLVQTRQILIPPCWPLHGMLHLEVVTLYWHWWAATAPGAQAEAMSAWFDRWLPGFQRRLRDHLDGSEEQCRAGAHPAKRPAEGEAAGYLALGIRGKQHGAIEQRIAGIAVCPAPRHTEVDDVGVSELSSSPNTAG